MCDELWVAMFPAVVLGHFACLVWPASPVHPFPRYIFIYFYLNSMHFNEISHSIPPQLQGSLSAYITR
jgi:hypothetical protein